ncbi:gamma-glutamylcyclotransferase [Alphaproteobacteria bacterium]|nr:gamma-glutamylcyclotransferase [Alphaproteobacteria bacterium]
MGSEQVVKITRESLANGTVAQLAIERDGKGAPVADEATLLASRRSLIADDFDCSNLWVFGYGSLIFNPILDYSEKIKSRIYGKHRRFCLWTRMGRGSPDCPGLVLALDRGGSCTGLAFRLKPENAIAELDLLWRREMLTLAYRPQLLRLHTDEGVKQGLAFVSNPDRPAYAQKMTVEEEVNVIAEAIGFLGPCSDYLFGTVNGLREHGIFDPHLEKLVRKVEQRLAL